MVKRKLSREKVGKIIAILETVIKEDLTRMVTFKHNIGERVNYVNISRENISNKGTASANRGGKRPLRERFRNVS